MLIILTEPVDSVLKGWLVQGQWKFKQQLGEKLVHFFTNMDIHTFKWRHGGQSRIAQPGLTKDY